MAKLTDKELAEAVKLYKAAKLAEADDDSDKKNVDFVDDIKKDDDDSEDKDSDDDDGDKEDDKEKVEEDTDEGGQDHTDADEKSEGGGTGSGESPFGSVEGKLKQGVSESKRGKRILTQSYREDEQPAVETLESPFSGDEGKLKVGVSEACSKIFDGAGLSEDFKKKAATVIEAVVKSLVKENTRRIEKIAQKNLAEATAEIEEELMEKADDYVGYVVAEWLEENKLQVESSLKTEIYEGFFEGLGQLYNEHNIAVPTADLDLLEAKCDEVESLSRKINSLTEKLMLADKKILEAKKSDVTKKLSEGLTATQAEKLTKLTEDIEAKNIEAFSEKASVIKETYFKDPSKITNKNDGSAKVTTTESIEPGMQKLLDQMKVYNTDNN